MKEGWKEIRIDELGRVVTGNTPSKKDPNYYGGTYPFIKPTDMVVGQRRVKAWDECYSEKAFQKYRRSYIPPGATGVVTIGTVGEKIFQADRYCFTNQSVNVVIPNDSYDKDFVYYLLKINLPKVENANPGTASGRHHVSKSNFCAIKVKVPESKTTQRKIARLLSAYDELIENNLRRIQLLEEMAQQTYTEWFVRMKFPGHEHTPVDAETGLPEGWRRVKLGEVAEMKFGYAFKSNQFNSDGLGKPIVRIRNIPLGKTNDFTTEKAKDRYLIKQGDLLVGMDGEFYINHWPGPDAYLVQRVCCLRCKQSIYNGFLGEAIKTPIKVLQQSIDGATVAHLGKKHLIEIELVIPDEHSKRLLNDFNYMLQTKMKLITQNQLLREARDLLLPRLMTGLVDVEELAGGEHEIQKL
ncbi:restriction endonuclease subunit S [Phaeodactylibacter xiamenensis]|uniref:restriction endonuclease subunit S n=1 Tax=Phaeodactylibacter xiamenensis TaxID=1524460 RepID=UPI0024A8A78B|nr:restriction endonuclease subunit S [Phaeodactylibacter xiamenensis]